MRSRVPSVVAETAIAFLLLCSIAPAAGVKWRHLSSANGDLPVPNPGDQQTASLVCDIDKDGVNDFVIAERMQAPALVWYRRGATGWTRCVVDDQPLHIEAGSDALDIDGDGDYDILDKPCSWQTPRLDIWLNEGAQ